MLCSLIGCLLCSVSRPCTVLIFEGHWATNSQCLSAVLQKNGFLNFLPSTYNSLLTYAVSTSLLSTSPFILDSLCVILVQQPYFLQKCAFSISFFFLTFMKFSMFFDPPSYSPHVQSRIEFTQSLVNFKLTHFFMLEPAKTYQKLIHPTK